MKKTLKNMIAMVLIIAVAAASTVILSGCGGGPATLQEYLESNKEAMAEIENLGSSLGTGGSVEVKDNNLIVTYKYDTTYDASYIAPMKEAIDEAMAQSKSTFDTFITTLEEDAQIEGVTVTVIYLNGDGSEISKTVFE